MAIKSGFFNSEAGDRKYDAEDINSFFSGVITDGVLSAIGEIFVVEPSSGLQISIGSGKAWFLASWIENTADAFLTLSDADVTFGRIDIIALDFDKSDQVRENDIIIVEGTPSGTPTPPALIDTATHLQMPLAHIQVDANETVIQSGDITIKVDTVDCPFSTGITELLVEVDDVTIEIAENEISIKDAGVDTAQLAPDAVDGTKIEDDAIGPEHIDDDAVDTPALANMAVGTTKIDNLAVTEVKIADGAVETNKLATEAVEAVKIAPLAVVYGKIAANAVRATQINALAVETAKLDNEAVTVGKIGVDAVTGAKIGNDQINSEHYVHGSIDNLHMAPNSIDSDQYVDASIDPEHLAANIIDDTKVGNRVPMLTRRKGGSATDWDTPGATNYTPTAVKMQCGSVQMDDIAYQGTDFVILTFPQAFSAPPVVVATSNSWKFTIQALPSATQVQIGIFNVWSSGTSSCVVHWVAVGPE